MLCPAPAAEISIDPHLVVLLGRVDGHVEHEAVELALGERIHALKLERVLRRDHEERIRQAMRDAVDRDRGLGHRLEQRALSFRRAAVQLVGEHEVREHRPRSELELVASRLQSQKAHDVARKKIARHLNSLEGPAERDGEPARERGLARAGRALEKQVPSGEKRSDRELDEVALAAEVSLEKRERRLERALFMIW